MKEAPTNHGPYFYMLAYLIDEFCLPLSFLAWSRSRHPKFCIHVYCQELLWEYYPNFFYEFYDHFLAQTHQILFCFLTPRIFEEATKSLIWLGNSYFEYNYTYIQTCGCLVAPHLMPQLFPDWQMIRKISYQTIGVRITLILSNDSKKSHMSFPIRIGHYTHTKFPQATKEANNLKEIKLLTSVFRRHEPHEIIKEHCRLVNLSHA